MQRVEYRRAKKFKLDENLEVSDFFTGSAKNPIKADWNDYRNNHKHWQLHARPFRRLINKSVGKSWNEVRSYFKRKIYGRGEFIQYSLEHVFECNSPQETVIKDGVLQFKKQRYSSRRGGLDVPSNGELYIGVDGIVAKAPITRPKYRGYNYRNRPDNRFSDVYGVRFSDKVPVKAGNDTVFKEKIHTYNFRLGGGKFKVVEQYDWFKWTHVEYMGTETYYEGNDRKTRPVLKTRLDRKSANKKDIRDFKLNEI